VLWIAAIVALPFFELTGFLLGASVLAPIFMMGEVGKTKDEQTAYKQWPYISALLC
jgi:hypothetical protein